MGGSKGVDMAEQKDSKELHSALNAIEKEFGKGAIMSLGDQIAQDVEGISTGRPEPGHRPRRQGAAPRPGGRDLRRRGERQDDHRPALRGQRPEATAAWPRSSTPSTPSTRAGPSASASTSKSLLVSQPGYGEEALRIAEMLIKSNAVDLIVIDSVAALVPKNEIQNNEIGDADDGHAGPAHEPGAAGAQPDAQQEPHVHDLHQPDPPEDRRACTATRTRPPAGWR